ncbi:FUSC family protein, partial [Streptomyces parvus]|nr:FUSC family protein [Streptomyces parvus]
RTDRIARLLTAEPPGPTPRSAPDRDPPSPLSVDLEVWMTGLAHQLARIESSLTPAPGVDPPVTPRGRTARPG